MNLTTLEQSRKLKEWGAPQDTGHYWCTDLGEITLSKNCEPYEKRTCGDHIAAYDLESLIGWPGDRFDSLHQSRIGHGWIAYESGNNPNGHTGSNALEAVYALAEAIHGKEAV